MKITLKLSIIFAIILLTQYSFVKLFPDWILWSGTLITINNILAYLSFCGLPFCIALYFRVGPWLMLPIGLLLFPIFFIGACSAIFPIDTTTNPNDVQVLMKYSDGRKLVVRKYKNVKTNERIQDTVVVKDVFIFRRLYKNNSTLH